MHSCFQNRFSHYVWPCFIIWGLDRLIRAGRLLAFNLGRQNVDAKVELVSQTVVRLSLKRPRRFHWSPGQVAYIITPSVSNLPFEAHPFTIANIDSSVLKDSAAPGTPSSHQSEKTVDKTEAHTSANDIVFFINVHGGFTRRLADVAARSGTAAILIDGPYGRAPSLRSYDTCVLIAGLLHDRCIFLY